MADTYTTIGTPCGEYLCHGRKTRAEAIAEVRSSYEYQLEQARAFLAIPDVELKVTVVRGKYRQTVLDTLEPDNG